jgi:hypothetical protein
VGFRAPLLFSHPLAKGPRNLQLGLLVVARLAIADVSTVLGVHSHGCVHRLGLAGLGGSFWCVERYVWGILAAGPICNQPAKLAREQADVQH